MNIKYDNYYFKENVKLIYFFDMCSSLSLLSL